MNFKEYFDAKLEEDIFIECLLGEGIFNSVMSPIKFAAGAGTNLVSQVAKGGFDVAKGGLNLAKGMGNTGLGLLQHATGDDRKSLESLRKGGRQGFEALKGVASGAAKIGLSPFTATIRGAQASQEKLTQGMDPSRSDTHKFWGINTWNKPEEQKQVGAMKFDKLVKMHQAAKTPQERKQLQTQLQQLDPQRYERLISRSQVAQKQNDFNTVMASYKNAKTPEEKQEILSKLKQIDSQRFADVMARAKSRKVGQAMAASDNMA